VVLLLLIIGGLLFFRVDNYIVGDSDPGYYFNNGYHIAQTGSVTVYDSSIPQMSDFEISAFYNKGIVQFFSFHLRNRQTGKIRPLLYDMLPAWIGLFIMLFGRMAGLYVVPLFSLLAMLMVYAIARRYAGIWASFAGAVLATLFFPQVWFSRYPVSEIFAQFFILAALLFFLQMRENDNPMAGLASALALAVAATARPEALLIILPPLIIIIVDMIRGKFRTGQRVFINTLLVSMIYLWIYIRFAEYEYFYKHTFSLLKVAKSRHGVDILMYVAMGLILAGLVVFNLKPLHRLLSRIGLGLKRRYGSRVPRFSLALRVALAVMVVFIFIFYYFIEPGSSDLVFSSSHYFFNMAVFFGGIGIFVFAAAFALMVVREDNVTSFLFASVVIMYVVAFSENKVTSPYLPWEARRYMSVAIPLLFVGAAYAFSFLWSRRNLFLRVLTVGIAAGFIVMFSIFIAPIFNHVDYRGIDKQLAKFAARAGGDVVIFTDPFLAEMMGVPLRYQYHIDSRTGYYLNDAVGLESMVRKYNKRGRKVILELGGDGVPTFDPAILDKFSIEPAFSETISYPRLSITYNSRPQKVGSQVFGLNFFYLEPRGSEPSN